MANAFTNPEEIEVQLQSISPLRNEAFETRIRNVSASERRDDGQYERYTEYDIPYNGDTGNISCCKLYWKRITVGVIVSGKFCK